VQSNEGIVQPQTPDQLLTRFSYAITDRCNAIKVIGPTTYTRGTSDESARFAMSDWDNGVLKIDSAVTDGEPFNKYMMNPIKFLLRLNT